MIRDMQESAAAAFVLVNTILLTVCQPVSADFAYAGFSTTDGLVFNGDAAPGPRGVMRVTPAVEGQGGSVYYESKQSVGQGFETEFAFSLSMWGPSNWAPADGLAFVIQNSNIHALGFAGSQMGYGGDGGVPGIPNSIAVEFDPYMEGVEMEVPHISVQTRGTLDNSAEDEFSIGSTTSISDITDGVAHTARISYVPGELSIYFDDSGSPVLTVPLDLSDLLMLDDGKAWVGFTAATGGAYENHDILSWEFSEVHQTGRLLIELVSPDQVLLQAPSLDVNATHLLQATDEVTNEEWTVLDQVSEIPSRDWVYPATTHRYFRISTSYD